MVRSGYIGNKTVWRHGLHILFGWTSPKAVRVFDGQLFFNETSEFQGTEMNVPDAVVDFFETNILVLAD